MIPDEAVEAALSSIEHLPTVTNESRRKTILAILEAAAPHLMAAVWDEGFQRGTLSQFEESTNPYRKPANG